VSRKSVPFTVLNGSPGAGGRRLAPEVIDAHSDEWVSDRNSARDSAAGPAPGLLLDLAAERGLAETIALSVFTPVALGWFWLTHAMSGRVRL
jgi:hypothetical protein